MSSSKSRAESGSANIQIHVNAGDPATEIFLLDAKFQLVDRGVGHLQSSVSPGIYKVKAQVGKQVQEELLIAEEGSSEIVYNFAQLTIPSAAPLEHSAKSREFHQQAAHEYNQQTHVTAGEGSWIYLFTRDLLGEKAAAEAAHPAQGLTLHDAQGTQLVDYVESSSSNLEREPYAGCNVAVNPGFYRLRLTLPDGARLEQGIVASPGWQTQIYLLQSDYPCEPDPVRRADLAGATITLSRTHSFDPANQHIRLSELARLALTNARSILSEELRDLLHGKFDDPMLGIFGGHLLLMEEELDSNLLSFVVKNLRNLLNDPHPDVEALALRLPTLADAEYRFEYPPMLARSWNLVLPATLHHPELVPAGSLAAHMASHRWGTELWLLWMEFAPTPAAYASLEMVLSAEGTPEASPEEFSEAEAAVREYFERRDRDQKRRARGQKTGQSPESVMASESIIDIASLADRSEETLQALVAMLRLPRGEVEQILDKLFPQSTTG